MKLKLMKNVEAVLVVALLSTPVVAEVTDGSIPCNDVANNQEMYGCLSQQQEAIANKKLSCLQALKEFQVPKKAEALDENFTKPGKLLKGKDMVAMGKEDGKIAIIDKLKNYQLRKDKIKQAIQDKLGAQAGSKPHFCVIVQSPKGKIKLKFKKKVAQGGSGSFDLGKWEKIPMEEGESAQQDDAFIALGSQDELQDAQVALSEKEKLAEKVQNFDSEVEEKLSEIRQETQEKITETRQHQNLTESDKRNIIENLVAEKQEKENFWRMKKERKPQLLENARTKCQAQPNVIAESVLQGRRHQPMGGFGIGGQFGRGVATNR